MINKKAPKIIKDHPSVTILERISEVKNLKNYMLILFVRNPYKRLVSGFQDKYSKGGQYRKDKFIEKFDKNNFLTFEKFCNELFTNKYNIINKAHFSPQFSEYDIKLTESVEKTMIYDLENIDYLFLEKLYSVKFPENILNFRGSQKIFKIRIKEYKTKEIVKDKPLDSITEYIIPYRLFYDETLKKSTYNFYKIDFEFLEKNNISYD